MLVLNAPKSIKIIYITIYKIQDGENHSFISLIPTNGKLIGSTPGDKTFLVRLIRIYDWRLIFKTNYIHQINFIMVLMRSKGQFKSGTDL